MGRSYRWTVLTCKRCTSVTRLASIRKQLGNDFCVFFWAFLRSLSVPKWAQKCNGAEFENIRKGGRPRTESTNLKPISSKSVVFCQIRVDKTLIWVVFWWSKELFSAGQPNQELDSVSFLNSGAFQGQTCNGATFENIRVVSTPNQHTSTPTKWFSGTSLRPRTTMFRRWIESKTCLDTTVSR